MGNLLSALSDGSGCTSLAGLVVSGKSSRNHTLEPIYGRLGIGPTAARSTILWPEGNPVLSLAVLVFAVGAVGGGVETAMITFYGQHEFHQRLLRYGKILIVPYLSAAITAVAPLWFSIASA